MYAILEQMAIFLKRLSKYAVIRPVLNLTANTQVSDGDGTKENPFVVA